MAKGVIETWDKLEDFKRRDVKFDGLKRGVFLPRRRPPPPPHPPRPRGGGALCALGARGVSRFICRRSLASRQAEQQGLHERVDLPRPLHRARVQDLGGERPGPAVVSIG
ncbi:MAG: hypothetical protein IPG56_11890 [Caulobacteraceae bacterium]|nr:hypothetical protein [Caulobacteraceae bacterium]